MRVNLCRHIKSNGIQCHAVALRDNHFCCFHHRLNEGHRLYRLRMVGAKGLTERGFIIPLPAMEDRLSVQLAISEVLNALACNFIDAKRANAFFYGLQLASSNCKGLETIPNPTAVVRDCDRAPDIIEAVRVDIAPPGRTIEIEDPAPAQAEENRPSRPAACPSEDDACHPITNACHSAPDHPITNACHSERSEESPYLPRHRPRVPHS